MVSVSVVRCLELFISLVSVSIISDPKVIKLFYAPNFEKVGSILVLACPCVHVSVRSFQKFKIGF